MSAFLPPVSGGAATDPLEISRGGHYFALTRHTIDTHAVIARLLTGAEGAVVTSKARSATIPTAAPRFGVDYECYESMALKTMARVGREIAGAHQVASVAMVTAWARLLVGKPVWR